MAYEEFTQILQTFDVYLKLLDDPSMNQNITYASTSKAFNCCMFIETAVARAKTENRTQIFENHLHTHWRKMKRTRMYTCSELQLACDKLLEVLLKSQQVTTEIANKLFHLYAENCGWKRLNSFFVNLLSDTLSGNILINSIIELGLSNSIIENEVRIIVWENVASCGQYDEIYQAIHQMINEGHVKKLLEYILVFKRKNSVVEKLIIEIFVQRINMYDVSICLSIIGVKRKLLRQLLENPDFQISFMDAIFYFGRNMMKKEDGLWKSNNLFTYRHLVKIMHNLLTITDQIGNLTNQRLNLAKTQMDGAIWSDIEKICNE